MSDIYLWLYTAGARFGMVMLFYYVLGNDNYPPLKQQEGLLYEGDQIMVLSWIETLFQSWDRARVEMKEDINLKDEIDAERQGKQSANTSILYVYSDESEL